MRTIRTYLAGIGSGGSLVAAAVVAFVAVGAIVAFNGVPGLSSESDATTITVGAPTNAPEIAAATAAAPDSAPAPVPATTSDSTLVSAASPGSGSTGAGPAPGAPAPPTRPGPAPGPPPPSGSLPAPSPGGGLVGGAVDSVDGTLGDLTGLDSGVSGTTRDLTDTVDRTLDNLVGGSSKLLPGGVKLPGGSKLLP